MTQLSKRLFASAAALAALALVAGGLWYALKSDPAAITARLVPNSEILSAPPIEGFKRVTSARAFRFPDDHGPHSDYQTEWWYYTGNLAGPDGRKFGYQLTFFRHAFTATPITRTSEWATSDSYLAHFTITDVENNRFYAFEQASRGAAGLAGATAVPYHVFVANWSAEGDLPIMLTAGEDVVQLALELESTKPPTLQGNSGVSPRSPTPGDASYYYSLTRLKTTGTIQIDGERFSLEGNSWFDHEWSTGLLDRNQVGWDWFGIHLGDGQDIKWGQIRNPDGSLVIGNGTVTGVANTGRDGALAPITELQKQDLQLTVIETWTSPHSGVTYPARWRMEIPKAGIDVEIQPLIPDQELRFPLITYWEGAVRVTGTHNGFGYTELTGYGSGGK